jgi:hypothetical protein
MKSSAEEIKIIEQVLNHLDHDSTDQQADLIRVPTTEYTSPDRLEEEIAICSDASRSSWVTSPQYQTQGTF